MAGVQVSNVSRSFGAHKALDDVSIDFADGGFYALLGPSGSGKTTLLRQIAGFGTGDDTNRRFKYLISQGQTGLSTDFDMPTLMGYDSDDPRSEGEVGREGVAVDTVDDMHALYDGIDLENISVSMTINAPAWILLAMYLVVAEERGIDWKNLSGTAQTDQFTNEVIRRVRGKLEVWSALA